MNKFVIFDLDGTLIDTCEGITKAVNNTLEHFNYPYHYSKEEIIKFLGHGAIYLYKKATKKDDMSDEEFNYFTVEYVKTQNISSVYPFVKETLEKLYKKGYKLMVYSNKPNGALQFLIREKLPSIRFLIVQGNVPEYPAKPDPTLLNKILKDNKLDTIDGYYVGDSIVALETARNTNLKSVILTYGYGDYEDIKAHNPDYMINSFDKLLDILD